MYGPSLSHKCSHLIYTDGNEVNREIGIMLKCLNSIAVGTCAVKLVFCDD